MSTSKPNAAGPPFWPLGNCKQGSSEIPVPILAGLVIVMLRARTSYIRSIPSQEPPRAVMLPLPLFFARVLDRPHGRCRQARDSACQSLSSAVPSTAPAAGTRLPASHPPGAQGAVARARQAAIQHPLYVSLPLPPPPLPPPSPLLPLVPASGRCPAADAAVLGNLLLDELARLMLLVAEQGIDHLGSSRINRTHESPRWYIPTRLPDSGVRTVALPQQWSPATATAPVPRILKPTHSLPSTANPSSPGRFLLHSTFTPAFFALPRLASPRQPAPSSSHHQPRTAAQRPADRPADRHRPCSGSASRIETTPWYSGCPTPSASLQFTVATSLDKIPPTTSSTTPVRLLLTHGCRLPRPARDLSSASFHHHDDKFRRILQRAAPTRPSALDPRCRLQLNDLGCLVIIASIFFINLYCPGSFPSSAPPAQQPRTSHPSKPETALPTKTAHQLPSTPLFSRHSVVDRSPARTCETSIAETDHLPSRDRQPTDFNLAIGATTSAAD
ncbi:hypothetical protein TCAP_05092 [Tolypocladium capitatum]|uniref:Uncharacterized protein n=1 Tax=Tolypocladium capitatum TaxID=45235 RepID=A0A2K3QBP1_9HYPO|nr:hypothetical protein TCAP_05092 [Tolypocladium capitatum]